MPVSSPGYFGPARGGILDKIVGQNAGIAQTGSRVFLAGLNAGNAETVDDLIVIGSQSVDNGLTLGIAAKSLVLGNGSLKAWTALTSGAPTMPMLIIGHNVLPNSVANAGCVLIGNDIMSQFPAGAVGTSRENNVVIGQGAASYQVGAGGAAGFGQNVVIGYRAASQTGLDGNNRNYSGNVVVGSQAGYCDNAIRSYTSNIAIGSGAGTITNGVGCDNNIFVGNGNNATSDNTLNTQFNICIGHNSQVAGSSNIHIGHHLVGPIGPGAASIYNIIIGAETTAGQAFANNQHDMLLLGPELQSPTLNYAAGCVNYDLFIGNGNINKMLMYGNMNNGNVMVGNNVGNRAIGGAAANCFSLTNGAKGNNPIGGGYFYVVAGALHWVGSAGTDTVVAPA